MLWVYLDYFRNIVGISQRTLPSVYLSQVQIDFLFRLRLVIISLHTRPVKILLLEVYECLIRCRKISQTWYSKLLGWISCRIPLWPQMPPTPRTTSARFTRGVSSIIFFFRISSKNVKSFFSRSVQMLSDYKHRRSKLKHTTKYYILVLNKSISGMYRNDQIKVF